MSSKLFSPLSIAGQSIANRIVVSPMCQYSADDGSATPWHHVHLGGLSGSGAGLVMIEATAVERIGRITHGCLGLYSDRNQAALQSVLDTCKATGNAQFGIQLGHAGRKGSTHVPWAGGSALDQTADAWLTVSPSGSEDGLSRACESTDLDRIREAFVRAAQRAVEVGINIIELHAAHGYLLHQFLSPLANQRQDEYGGSLENRMRFPLEVFAAVKAAIPSEVALGARITGTDWLAEGVTIEEAVMFARELEAAGCAFLDVTSGGVAAADIPVGPGYQVHLAEQIKAAVAIPVMTVGMIVSPAQAEEILSDERADAVMLGRAFLDNPHWPYEAAQALGEAVSYPPQYQRAAPGIWPGVALKSGTPEATV